MDIWVFFFFLTIINKAAMEICGEKKTLQEKQGGRLTH
jgi:hypothetical protein